MQTDSGVPYVPAGALGLGRDGEAADDGAQDTGAHQPGSANVVDRCTPRDTYDSRVRDENTFCPNTRRASLAAQPSHPVGTGPYSMIKAMRIVVQTLAARAGDGELHRRLTVLIDKTCPRVPEGEGDEGVVTVSTDLEHGVAHIPAEGLGGMVSMLVALETTEVSSIWRRAPRLAVS